MPQRAAVCFQGVIEQVAGHLHRTLPAAGGAGALEPGAIRAAVTELVASGRRDLALHVVEDDEGPAAVLMVKERRSVLAGAREGFVYCVVPCRTGPTIVPATVARLDRLMRERRWAVLRLSVLAADAPALAPVLAATNLNLGWVVARKDLGGAAPLAEAPPGTTRAVRGDDLEFICSGWRDAFAAGLQEEAAWPARRSAAQAADIELARLLDSERCAMLVIESRGERVGFVAAEVGVPDPLTGRPECLVHDCYVAPARRGQGFSQRGMGDIEAVARDAGCEWMNGTVTGPSGDAIGAILAQIGQQGWVPHQLIHRCRAPLLAAPVARSAPSAALSRERRR